MCTTEPHSMQSISILNQIFFKNSNLIQKHIKGFVNRRGLIVVKVELRLFQTNMRILDAASRSGPKFQKPLVRNPNLRLDLLHPPPPPKIPNFTGGGQENKLRLWKNSNNLKSKKKKKSSLKCAAVTLICIHSRVVFKQLYDQTVISVDAIPP